MIKRLGSIILILMFLATSATAGSVSTMDKDQLKSLLGNDDVVVLDVRTGKDWSTSEFKIQNALRLKGKDLSVVDKYSKDHTFVLYCA